MSESASRHRIGSSRTEVIGKIHPTNKIVRREHLGGRDGDFT